MVAPDNRRVAMVCLRAVAVAGLLMGAWRMGAAAWGGEVRNDFAHYYLSAQMLLAGENPYTTPLGPRCAALGFEQDPRIPYGANPPLLIGLFTLFAWAPAPWAFAGWLLAQAATLAALLDVVRRIVLQRVDATWLLVGGAVLLNSTTLARHFYYAQVQLLVGLVLALALLASLRGRGSIAVALAAAATVFKLYPAVLIPWFLFHKLHGGRDFAERLAAGVAVGLSAIGLVGPELWLSFVRDGLPVIQLSVGGSWTNYSIPSLVKMLAGAAAGDIHTAPPWAATLGKCLGMAAVAACYLRAFWGDLNSRSQLSLLTLAMLAASPICWSHYFVLAALPSAALIVASIQHGGLAVAVSTGLCALVLFPELDLYVPVGEAPISRVLLHYYPLAGIGLMAWGLCRYGKHLK